MLIKQKPQYYNMIIEVQGTSRPSALGKTIQSSPDTKVTEVQEKNIVIEQKLQ